MPANIPVISYFFTGVVASAINTGSGCCVRSPGSGRLKSCRCWKRSVAMAPAVCPCARLRELHLCWVSVPLRSGASCLRSRLVPESSWKNGSWNVSRRKFCCMLQNEESTSSSALSRRAAGNTRVSVSVASVCSGLIFWKGEITLPCVLLSQSILTCILAEISLSLHFECRERHLLSRLLPSVLSTFVCGGGADLVREAARWLDIGADGTRNMHPDDQIALLEDELVSQHHCPRHIFIKVLIETIEERASRPTERSECLLWAERVAVFLLERGEIDQACAAMGRRLHLALIRPVTGAVDDARCRHLCAGLLRMRDSIGNFRPSQVDLTW